MIVRNTEGLFAQLHLSSLQFTDAAPRSLFFLCTDFQDAPTEASPEEIKRQAEKWVMRCKYAAASVVVAWIGWIVTAQVLRDQFPSSWYMMNANDEKLTGW